MKANRTVTRVLAGLLVVAGLAVTLYPLSTDARYSWQQGLMAAEAAASPAGLGGIRLPRGAVARIAIPKIGLKAYVLEGTGREILDQAPGHYPETPLPGDSGNAAIAAHRTMHGHAFRRLNELRRGDRIVTWTRAKKAVWRVVWVKAVDPSKVDVVAPVKGHRLTLTTCHPVGSARQRLVVAAVLER